MLRRCAPLDDGQKRAWRVIEASVAKVGLGETLIRERLSFYKTSHSAEERGIGHPSRRLL